MRTLLLLLLVDDCSLITSGGIVMVLGCHTKRLTYLLMLF